MQQYAVSFPVAVLDPGEKREVEAVPHGPFCPDKIAMVGLMDEVRGHFRIRYSRLPLLDREHVIAYSNVARVKAKRRTTVEYREGAAGNFVRSYLPSSVEYVPTDPLSYVTLDQIFCDEAPGMRQTVDGFSALFFGAGVLGNRLSLLTSRAAIKVALQNHGDIQVRVHVQMYGRSFDPPEAPTPVGLASLLSFLGK